MKLFLLHPIAARWMPVVVIASALIGAPSARAQSGVNVAGLQEQGDEMSRQVGGFFRKLFYGEDRNANNHQQGQYQQPQQQPYQTAPQRQPGYQYAPPPVNNSQRNAPPPQRQRPVPQQTPATTSRKAPSRIAEPEKPKHKEEPVTNRASTKRPPVQSTPPTPKREEDPPGKQVAKRKSYTPPTIAGDDSSEPKAKKTPKSEPPKPAHKEKDSVAKSNTQDQPPSPKKSAPSTVAKSNPPSSKDEPGGISPYADGYAGSGTTIKAPKETPPAKTEEPKSKETKPSNPAAGGDGTYPTGTMSATHPGTVVSPYPPHNELDVSGLPSGSLAIDPTTKKVFKVP